MREGNHRLLVRRFRAFRDDTTKLKAYYLSNEDSFENAHHLVNELLQKLSSEHPLADIPKEKKTITACRNASLLDRSKSRIQRFLPNFDLFDNSTDMRSGRKKTSNRCNFRKEEKNEIR